MKIRSLAAVIGMPFILLALFFAFYVFYLEADELFVFLLVFVIITVLIYMFQPQIDYFWYSKHPLPLSEKERMFLNDRSSFYRELSEIKKLKFENRLDVFMRSKDFKWVQKEQKVLLQDMILMVASNAIQLTLELEDFLFDEFDIYFAYNHPSPTPDKKFLHSVEVNIDDKLAIFNMEVVINAQNIDNKIFNIGLWGFSEIFIYLHPGKVFPSIEQSQFWNIIKEISDIDKEEIIKTIGYEPESQFSIIITIFFMYNEEFKNYLPEIYKELSTIFNFQ